MAELQNAYNALSVSERKKVLFIDDSTQREYICFVDEEGKDTSAPIVFSEWTLISGTQMQRSDYTMSDLLTYNDNSVEDGMGNLFALTEDEKEEGGIFLRRYITHYKKVQDYGE